MVWISIADPEKMVGSNGRICWGSEEEFVFPDPIGKRKIYTVTAHPDIVLIPMFSQIRRSIFARKKGHLPWQQRDERCG